MNITGIKHLFAERDRLIEIIRRIDPKPESESAETPSKPPIRISTPDDGTWRQHSTHPIPDKLQASIREQVLKEWAHQLDVIEGQLKSHNIDPFEDDQP